MKSRSCLRYFLIPLLFAFQALGGTIQMPATPRGADTSELDAKTGQADLTGNRRLEVHVVDVEQGDCILLLSYPADERGDDTRAILVDCGTSKWPIVIDGKKESREQADARMLRVAQGAKEYLDLAFKNIPKRINTLVITHTDADHYNLVPFVLSGYDIKRVLLIGSMPEYGSRSVAASGEVGDGYFKDWLKSDVMDGRLEFIRQGCHDSAPSVSRWFDSQEYGPLDVKVLAAEVGWTSEGPGDANARSIVLMASLDMFDIILSGDAQGITDQAVIKDHGSPPWPSNFLDCDVLKVAHHGSESHRSNLPSWFEEARPEVAVVSARLGLEYGHPRQVTTDNISQFTVPAPSHAYRVWKGGKQDDLIDLPEFEEAQFLTATNGNIRIFTDGKNYNIFYEDDKPGLR